MLCPVFILYTIGAFITLRVTSLCDSKTSLCETKLHFVKQNFTTR